jgi:hypothetical protein
LIIFNVFTFSLYFFLHFTTGPVGKKGVPNATKPAAKVSVASSSQEKQPKKWTAEDAAATKIQSTVRRFLARKKLCKLRAERENYEEQMERLEREVLRGLLMRLFHSVWRFCWMHVGLSSHSEIFKYVTEAVHWLCS